jgi:hypothetical protein
VITYYTDGDFDQHSAGLFRPLLLEGQEPSSENVKSGKYLFRSSYNLILNKENENDKVLLELVKLIFASREKNFEKLKIVY